MNGSGIDVGEQKTKFQTGRTNERDLLYIFMNVANDNILYT